MICPLWRVILFTNTPIIFSIVMSYLYVGYTENNAAVFSWPVTKLGMWNFRWNKFEVSSIFDEVVNNFDR